ncbi:MAG: transcriptional regulator, partial [Nitrospirae bacterium]
MKRGKEPEIPTGRSETLRKEMISLLEQEPLTPSEIAYEIGVKEQEVYEHLMHIQRSLSHRGKRLSVTPPECLGCGYIFRKRDRLKRPGKCPVCKST